MAAILKFRRGNPTATNLQISEPFWNDVDNTLNIGTNGLGAYITLVALNQNNVGDLNLLTGTVSAAHGVFTGNVDLDGDLFVGGNVTVGNGGNDTIIINAPFSGSLIPDTDLTYDLGSPSKQWRYLYAQSASFDSVEASSMNWSGLYNIPIGIVSSSSQINHNTTQNYVADRHIDHSTLSISAGLGLSGGGVLTSTRILTLATGSTHFISGITDILNDLGVISGSSGYTDADTLAYINSLEVLSGSLDNRIIDNLTLTNTVVSGSFSGSYVGDGSGLSGVTSYTDTDTLIFINSQNVLSGSITAGNGITITPIFNGIEIGTTVGTAQIDRFVAVGGEVSASLTYELEPNYKYQVFFNGVLQKEGTGADYTLTYITGSGTIVNFETPLIVTDFVDIYYNTSDIAGGGSGGGLSSIVEDTSPQLGATLDGQFNDIVNITNITATNFFGNGSGLTGIDEYTDADNLIYLNTIGVLSGSISFDGLISGSDQLTSSLDIRYELSGSAPTLPSGLVSGSTQISYIGITDKPTLVSGSSQISYIGITDKPTLVSGSDQLTSSLDIRYELSGSAPTLPSGLVSSSIQIDHNTTTNYTASEHFEQSAISITESQISDLTHTVIPDGTVSGSSQISFTSITDKPNLVSGSSQISFNGITDKPTLISGSSQISFTSITDKPTLVSGSVQIDVTQTTNYSSINQYTDADNLSYLNTVGVQSGSEYVLPSNVVSGSAQVTSSLDTRYEPLGAVQPLPSDIISGSIQVDHDQTTNFVAGEHFLQSAISIPSSQLTDNSDIFYTNKTNTGVSTQFGVSGSNLASFVNEFSISPERSRLTHDLNFQNGFITDGTMEAYQELSIDRGTAAFAFYVSDGTNAINFSVTTDGFNVFTDNISHKGLTYGGDYSSNFVPNSLVTKQFVEAQISNSLPENIVSGSSQISFTGITDKPTLVSGSSQIDVTQTTNYSSINQYTDTDNLNYLNTVGVFSGSLDGMVSGSSQISFNGITDKPTLVSGSSQIEFTDITNVPTTIISGSSQLTGSFVNIDGDVMTGWLTAPKYIKTGATDDDILLGDGTTTSLAGLGGEYYVGTIDPSGSAYPDTFGETNGAYWIVTNLGTGSFTYTTGSLNGYEVRDGYKEVYNGVDFDIIIPPATNWGVIGGTISSQGDLQSELDAKENSFTKNSAFNKDFGTTTGSVAQGNHEHTFSEITSKPTLVSGSSQIEFTEITNVPTTIISGSSQVSYTGLSNIPSGVISGSDQISGSFLNLSGDTMTGTLTIISASLSYNENLNVDSGSTEIIGILPTSSYSAGYFDFLVKKTTNIRSGTIYAIHDGTNVEYTETSTVDLGDTSDVTFVVVIDNGNLALEATTVSDDWEIKTLIRGL